MNHCSFEGTAKEVLRCMECVEDHVIGEAEHPVSGREIDQFRYMVINFVNWLGDMALLDGEGLRRQELEKVCKSMAKGYQEEA